MKTTSNESIARAVIRRDGKVLRARHNAESWSFLPGGHVEPGEPVEDDATHHELNLVFDVELAELEVASREAHLRFERFAFDQLADVDLRPGPLKDALTAPHSGEQFWKAWTPTVG